ncbi:hypothetical protein ACWGJT_26510 [Streptomyces xantholiticus]
MVGGELLRGDVPGVTDLLGPGVVGRQHPDSCGNDVVRLTDDEAVRYVRVQGVERRTAWGYSIHEMGVCGAPAALTAHHVGQGAGRALLATVPHPGRQAQ